MTPSLPRPSPSLWAAVTPPAAVYPPLVGVRSADVVIIGAGFTGLAAALHLRRVGLDVVVLEASEPGSGASGRNNGQVIPTLSRADPDQIIATHRVPGERFVGLIAASAQALFETIAAENIDAEAEQTGWVQPVHSPGRMRLAEARVAQWRKAGANVALLTAEELTRKLGANIWHGGWWAPSGGHINPLALARGLAAAVVARGGSVHGQTPALAFGRAGARWVVTAPLGRVDARALIVATNVSTAAFAPGLAPQLAREIIPLTSWQMATPPVPESLRPLVLPGRQAVSDTRADMRFMRYDARHRLITGGTFPDTMAPQRAKAEVRRRLVAAFPQLAAWPGAQTDGQSNTLTFDPVSTGQVGMTRDGLPRVHLLGPDGYAWVGCNGRGVALAMAIGREFARGILGVPRSELALPFTELEPIAWHALATRLAPLLLRQRRRRDRRDVS